MSNVFLVLQEDDFKAIVEFILSNYPSIRLFLLKGNLGAGKTTFVKHFVSHFDASVLVQSPTFSLVNHYKSDKIDVFHLDLYRLKNEDELIEAGIPEVVLDVFSETDNVYIFVEWFDLVQPWIESQALIVDFEVVNVSERKITLSIF